MSLKTLMTLKILWIFIKSMLKNHILFQLMILKSFKSKVLSFKKIYIYIIKIMTIDDQIKDEKQQYDINWDAEKMPAW